LSGAAPAPWGQAVVTGASSGIGAALARALAARGHSLMLVARRVQELEALASELRHAHGVAVEVRPCDLANRAELAELRAELAWREVSVLCNNAGFPTCAALADCDPVREVQALEVNVVAMQELTLAVLPGMLARRAGAILITGSNAGEQPVPSAATYSASKAFANTFAQALASELQGSGVSCTLLAPGPVRTGFAQAGGIEHMERKRWIAWMTPERVAEEALIALTAERRIVIPGAVAKVQALAGRYTPRRLLFPILRRVVLPRLRAGG
jgi:short-subunit dehydrogenase